MSATKDNRQQYDKIRAEISQLRGAKVQAGFFTEAIAFIAACNEFGTERIPERSFMRAAFDKNGKKYEEKAMKLLGLILEGKLTAQAAMFTLGQIIANDIKRMITSHPPPPNAPSTLAKKGLGKGTLIDTGRMRREVSFKALLAGVSDGPIHSATSG